MSPTSSPPPKPKAGPRKPRTPTAKKRTTAKSAAPKAKNPVRHQHSQYPLRALFFKLLIMLVVVFFAWAFYLNARVTTEFKGQLFAEPARVYAQPLALYPGLEMGSLALQTELGQLGYREVSVSAGAGTYWPTGNTLELVTRAYPFWDGHQSSKHLWIDFSQGRIESIRDSELGLVDLVRLDPLVIGSLFLGHKQDRHLLAIEDVPTAFIDSLLAVEDRNFYQHFGISPFGIARALFANLSQGGMKQGGSTLTQQLVKNYFLTRERSLLRKANEAIMALLLEWHFSKDQILEAYINEVFLLQDGARAVHGFGLAALELFGAPLSELNAAEQALLIGMVKGPSVYNPYRNPERAEQRRHVVLGVMRDQGIIQAAAFEQANARPLGVRSGVSRVRYPAYLDMVKRDLSEQFQTDAYQAAGLNIYTSLDPRIQSLAESALTQGLARLETQQGMEIGSLEGAVVITQPDTGHVLAMVGGRNPRFAGFNRAMDAQRFVGSLLKPAIYLTALEQGYTLATPISDGPVVVQGQDGSEWRPENYDRVSHGDPLLIDALSSSYNRAAARLGMQIGLDKVIARLASMGVAKDIPAYPSVLLGALALSPVDITTFYGAIAANGFYTPAQAITAVSDAEDRVLQTDTIGFHQVVSPAPLFLLQQGLQQVMTTGTARYAGNTLGHQWQLAGKTGTTDDLRDSWFAGYSPDYLAVVWVGRDDNQPTPLTGSSGALRIWTDIMKDIGLQEPIVSEPGGIDWHWVDSATGALSVNGCKNARYLPFMTGSAPTNKPECGKGNRVEPQPITNEDGTEKTWWQKLLGR